MNKTVIASSDVSELGNPQIALFQEEAFDKDILIQQHDFLNAVRALITINARQPNVREICILAQLYKIKTHIAFKILNRRS